MWLKGYSNKFGIYVFYMGYASLPFFQQQPSFCQLCGDQLYGSKDAIMFYCESLDKPFTYKPFLMVSLIIFPLPLVIGLPTYPPSDLLFLIRLLQVFSTHAQTT